MALLLATISAGKPHTTVLAGAYQGVMTQIHRDVQRLEDVCPTITDINPATAVGGASDPFKAVWPEGGFPLAAVALAGRLSFGGGLSLHQLLTGQTEQPTVAGTNGETVVLQQTKAFTVTDRAEIRVKRLVGGEVQFGGVMNNENSVRDLHGLLGEGEMAPEQGVMGGLFAVQQAIEAAEIVGIEKGRERGTGVQGQAGSGVDQTVRAAIQAEADLREVGAGPLDCIRKEPWHDGWVVVAVAVSQCCLDAG